MALQISQHIEVAGRAPSIDSGPKFSAHDEWTDRGNVPPHALPLPVTNSRFAAI